MILALAATQIEMQPFLLQWPEGTLPCLTLLTGVGPVETTFRLTRFLSENRARVTSVVNFGVAGAYLQPDGIRQPQLLDIGLAESEVFGDLGVCVEGGMDYLDESLTGDLVFQLDRNLLVAGLKIVTAHGVACHTGVFVTVSGVSATRRRGEMLRMRWGGLCENMEGAAIARVCREFVIPCLELRAISNFVEDRDPSAWRLREACLRAAEGAAIIIKGMSE